MTRNKGPNVVIDTGSLPSWPVAQAINLAYTEAVVRLQNALNMEEFLLLPEFDYRFTFVDPVAGERRVVVHKHSDSSEPVHLPFSVAISIMAILRLKDYSASYSQRKVISITVRGGGDGDKSDTDMGRMMVLLGSRPEFQIYELSQEAGYDETEGAKEEEAQVPPSEKPEGKSLIN